MRQIMMEHDHRYIDVLKVDVEGAEFPWLRFEGAEIIPRVGQSSLESLVQQRQRVMKYCVDLCVGRAAADRGACAHPQ